MDLSLLTAYFRWTASIWTGNSTPGSPTQRDVAVMGLGLAGESGEVAEVLLAPSLDAELLLKELGDALYYWARICDAFDLSAVDAWVERAHQAGSRDTLALALCARAGRVAEVLKKHIRDDNCAPQVLLAAMAAYAAAYRQLLGELEIAVEDVVAANQRKLMDRKSRGVLKGSGDNR